MNRVTRIFPSILTASACIFGCDVDHDSHRVGELAIDNDRVDTDIEASEAFADAEPAEHRTTLDGGVETQAPWEHDHDPSTSPDAEPPDSLQKAVNPVKADVDCSLDCETQTFSGTGLKTLSNSCGFGLTYMVSGGCNISDGSAADVHLVDNYPTQASSGIGTGTWTCKAYSNKTGSFDLQNCCMVCS